MSRNTSKLPPEQQAIRDKCFHSSGTFVEFPIEDVEISIPERFEKIVRMYPDRIAVKTGSEVVTYSELNVIANRVAHGIISRRGTKAEAVAILLDKGVRLMAAILAVLKSGKFFVLLDKSFPKARLSAVLGDSEAGLIISDREYREVRRHFVSADSNLLEFDSIASHVAEENINLKISPNSLAAIIYTSGSTGESKGVIWAHRNLLHQVMLFTNAYKLSEGDRVSLTTSGTGNAVAIGFLPLLNGATLLPFDVQSHGIKALVKWILQEKISICWFGSPLFRNICAVLTGAEQFPDVRILRLASEASYKSDIELYKQHFSPECILINGLSDTESGLICLYPVDSKTEILGHELPVGYPVEDKEVLLLDDAGREVGANEVGQIVVRSRYLSPGYWHRPELTAAKFKSDRNGGGQRIYLSGDLGLLLPDGCLIHKGRKDFRVKVRGYGVDTAEVEKVLNRHATVAQAAVVAREKESGEARLVAYYTSSGPPAPTVTELRSFLSEQLPDFMIPSVFVRLDVIPVTHSGKIDRRALPEPDDVRPELSTPYLLPRNEIEQKLVAIWEEVLDVCPVGVNDGFFDLGGDSLSATRVISQIIKHFQLDIPLQSLFQSPTIADMALVVAQQRGKLSANYNQDHVTGPSLVPVPRENFPLSYSQQRLWFLDQLDPGSFTYNVFSAYRLKGELNVAALEQSFNEILRRHEVLRTRFKLEGGNPVQVVLPVLAIKIPVCDLRGTVSKLDRWTEVRRMSKEEAQRPFHLATGPLLRITLLRLADDEYVFLQAMHHIVADAWSGGVLFRELAALYEAFLNGRPSPLADLPIQYADYAVWQRQWLRGEVLQSQLSYWKKQLENIPALRLPTDRPRPAVQNSSGARQYFTLSDTLSSEIKSLSRRQGVTVFMTLLAAFQTLLHRYSGQTDIVIGSPVAGRSRGEFEKLIGFFLNMLVLRTDLSGDPTFVEAMTRVQDVCLGALNHQELPFEKLVEELHPQRDLSQNPLFQVTFTFQNTPRFLPRLSNIAANQLELDSGIARFDLAFFMEEIDGFLKGHCDYDTNLFNADTIERMIGHFQTLLASLVHNPHQRITDISILTEPEKHQLVVDWNDTKRDYPKRCIHELIEEQVEKTPDAIAVVFEEQRLTYGELNCRANQLAHYLQKLGVGPESLVALCMERSIDMVVGLLGILKAGGAYVPLDPSYPKERLAFMLEDTQAAVLVIQSAFVSQLPKPIEDGPPSANNDQHRYALLDPRSRMVCLDTDWEKVSKESSENPSGGATAAHLAYVIYTSGSTGRPKGVMISHCAISNHMLWMQEALPLHEGDRVLQKTPFSFDASIWEFYAPLLAGARLVMAPPRAHQDSACLVKVLADQQVTVLQLVPSMLGFLVEEQGLQSCQSLRRVFCGGEVLPFQLRERFSGRSKAELYNLYGPTEATIDVTCGICEHSNGQSVSIGRPLANAQVYILDSYLQPTPIGVPGELYIGGDGLARGYLNSPELTAEKFIPNPFSDYPNSRLYRTGDLARYRSDGRIEFLGRIDNQVKIRGFRIELGEVETALAQHPSIQHAVVLAREDTPADKRLVAYLVASTDSAASASELRHFLQQKLPDYMVPSVFVFLDSLPLTPNGKVDRNALPAPDQGRPELEDAYEAPRTPMEEEIAAIWREVLKLDRVGIHDNFFDLGGHSLVAAQLVSRIRDAFRIELPLRRLFEGPTVAGLAKHIELARQETAGFKAVPIVAESFDDEWPLSFAQERFWFLEQLEPNNVAYHVTYVFRLIGPLNLEALEKAISELVRRHETLRTTFQVRNGKPVQVISKPGSSPLGIIDLRQHPPATRGSEIERILESERRSVFDLSRDLLLRATLLQLGTDEHVLLLNSHHIAWDLWSIGILFREFAALYRAYVAGKPSPLPDLTIQYRHYALWQRKVFDRAELQDHLTYWKEQLRGAPQSLNLSTDYARKPLGNRRGGRVRLILPKSLSDGLETLSREAGVTLFMTFLAAYQALLHRMTGQDDIVVGTPVTGRERLETERVIGLFLNTLALRTNLSGNPIFFDLLRRVREISLGAYEHQDLPFEKLVEELQPERDLTRTPIFQVLISMYNFKESTLELDGLSVKPLRFTRSHTLFDTSLFILEQNDGTQVSFQYDADLFEHSTIVRMLGYFLTLLKGIVAHPDQRISDLPLLTEAERHQLLIEWNDTKRNYPKDTCIHELFEDQVETTPDAIAVVFEDRQLTYRELNTRANQLAHYLRKLGVRPEVPVAICMERSIEMVVGLLGILKAGGAYVPLDPSYPKERLAFMLEDTKAPVLVTQSEFVSQLPKPIEDGQPMTANTAQPRSAVLGPRPRIVCLDTDWQEVGREPHVNPISQSTADSLAYVIYTSGSTGVPKGVEVRHRGVVRLLFGVDYVQLDRAQTLLHLAPISFDAATFEVWGALLHGGKCVLFAGKVPSAKDIGEVLKKHQVTTLWLTAALFNTVINDEPQALLDVKQLLIGGEALSVPQVKKGIALLPNTEIINGYGPTESTTFTCCYPIPRRLDDNLSSIPIGKPIGNTQVYILDSHLNPVPIGVPGELHIGGDGLARRYLNRPELTQEKFIPNPFSADPAASRLYKTGDLARYLPDGNIEFLGRMDNQVKIRGYRIELGEIEAVLAQHPGVREAIVLAREDTPGDPSTGLGTGKRLAAYIVPKESAPATSELRAYLKAKLPDYMVPNAFVIRDCLPLTPNGKVDREALASLAGDDFESEPLYIAPRNAAEEIIARIWAEILGRKRIGIHDNFFDLGGHSLKATQVVSRLRKSFRSEIPLRHIFAFPTIEELAPVIDSKAIDGLNSEKLDRLLSEVEAMSEEEAQELLSQKTAPRGRD